MNEAERLAEILEQTDQMHENADISSKETAAELRRLSAINAELVVALKITIDVMESVDGQNDCSRGINAAEQALEKAKQ
jgi:hypothetical protein